MPDEQKGTGTDDPPTVGNPDDAANYCDSENAPIVAAATPAKEIGSASSLSPQPSENKAESCLFKHNNSCINCEETFSSGHAPVTEIKVRRLCKPCGSVACDEGLLYQFSSCFLFEGWIHSRQQG